MTSGTKLAILVVLLLFVGAGIYVAFVAPPAAGEKDLNGGVTPRGEAAGGGSPSAPAVRETGRDGARPAGGTPPAQRPATSPPVGQRSGASAPATQRPEVQTPPAGDRVSQPPASARAGAPAAQPPIADPLARPTPPTNQPSNQSPGQTPSSPSSGDAPGATPPAPNQPTVTPPTLVTPRPTSGGSETSGDPRPAGGQPQGQPTPAPATSPRPTGSSAAPAATTERTHVVASGDTMTVLAERYFGDRNAWQLIAKANPLVDPAAMKVGTRLVIPSSAVAGAPQTPVSRPPAAPGAAGAPAVHEVAAGETLYSIARRHYGTPAMWELIYAANRERIGADPAALKVGMRLTLPQRPAARAAAGGSSNDS